MAPSPAPPVLESPESSEEQVVATGSDVTFACEASGSPAPAVTWLKLGETPALPSERVADGPRLSLGAVGPADTGVYACVASNEAGETSRAFSLLVMGACLPWAGGADPGEQPRDEPSRLPLRLAEPPQIEDASQPTEVAVAVGAPLELTCVVAGVPAPAVTWEKDGRPLAGPWLSAGNKSTLRINSVEVGAPPLLPHPRSLFVLFSPHFFPLLALCRWLTPACTPAWPRALLGRTAGASTSAPEVAWPPWGGCTG